MGSARVSSLPEDLRIITLLSELTERLERVSKEVKELSEETQKLKEKTNCNGGFNNGKRQKFRI